MKRILIMGLPGAGKTTLAQELKKQLELTGKTVDWYNADVVRKQLNDWDFSQEGRIRQSLRMKVLADNSNSEYVIADFVCPLPEMRINYQADYTIWMDTLILGRFENTNKSFIKPLLYDYRIIEQNAEKWAKILCHELI